MAVVTITSLSYDAELNQLRAMGDFTQLGSQDADGRWVDANGKPLIEGVVLAPEALGNRIANGYADGDAALTGIMLEHAGRIAPDATGTTIVWQSPSDEERAAQLDALADRVEAARVFYTSAG